ncbi:PTS transporter subunit EIIB [Demequina rhizosphaerae]|uniref:PTS transporter subunit EIIB n=1 Tax=Demequina rhizosphaerae TaxID=1638985 RepID=UPI000780CE7A|nr:PTS transporter subunit EIIB [Demequina rhizosphaerae]
MSAEVASLASSLIALAGGVDNIAHVDRCAVRLRLRLVDRELARVEPMAALPAVALAAWSGGEVHVAPRADLAALHRTVAAVVAARA